MPAVRFGGKNPVIWGHVKTRRHVQFIFLHPLNCCQEVDERPGKFPSGTRNLQGRLCVSVTALWTQWGEMTHTKNNIWTCPNALITSDLVSCNVTRVMTPSFSNVSVEVPNEVGPRNFSGWHGTFALLTSWKVISLFYFVFLWRTGPMFLLCGPQPHPPINKTKTPKPSTKQTSWPCVSGKWMAVDSHDPAPSG